MTMDKNKITKKYSHNKLKSTNHNKNKEKQFNKTHLKHNKIIYPTQIVFFINLSEIQLIYGSIKNKRGSIFLVFFLAVLYIYIL